MKSLKGKTFDLSADSPLHNMHNFRQPTLPEKNLVTVRSRSHRKRSTKAYTRQTQNPANQPMDCCLFAPALRQFAFGALKANCRSRVRQPRKCSKTEQIPRQLPPSPPGPFAHVTGTPGPGLTSCPRAFETGCTSFCRTSYSGGLGWF